MDSKNINNTLELFRSSDLALVAATSLQFPIESVDKSDERRVTFLFTFTDSLKDYIRNYQQGNLRVDPKEYFNQLRTVKSMLYDDYGDSPLLGGGNK